MRRRTPAFLVQDALTVPGVLADRETDHGCARRKNGQVAEVDAYACDQNPAPEGHADGGHTSPYTPVSVGRTSEGPAKWH